MFDKLNQSDSITNIGAPKCKIRQIDSRKCAIARRPQIRQPATEQNCVAPKTEMRFAICSNLVMMRLF